MEQGEGTVERDWRPAASGPSAANAAVVVTVQGRSGARVQFGFCHTSYSAVPAGGRLTMNDGGGNSFDNDIAAAGLTTINIPGDGLTFEAGQNVVVTLAAGGAGVIGKISLAYRYIRHR